MGLSIGRSQFGRSKETRWLLPKGSQVCSYDHSLCRSRIRLEFKSKPETNSGVFLRTPPKPTDPAQDCFELNVAPTDNPFPTGSLVGRAKVEPEAIGPLDPEEWQAFHALLDGDHIQIWVNGKAVVDYMDTTKRHSGLIGLQFREEPYSIPQYSHPPLASEFRSSGQRLEPMEV